MTQDYIRPFPRVVRIEPASQCNLTCSHCPTGTVAMTRSVMRQDVFDRLVEQLRPHKEAIKVAVIYHGGEPLLNRAFPSMVRTIKDLGVPFVKAVSNGMLLNEARCHELLDSGLDSIEFSLDGTSPEENNAVRRKSDFRTVIQNIKRFIDIRDARKRALPKILIATTQFVDPQKSVREQTATAPEFLVSEFSGSYKDKIEGMKATFATRWPVMNIDASVYDVYQDPEDTENLNFCDHTINTVTVRWNGDVVACCYDLTSKLVLGNIGESDLNDIWNNEAYLNLRRSIDTREYIEPCSNCNTVRPKVYLLLKKSATGEAARGA